MILAVSVRPIGGSFAVNLVFFEISLILISANKVTTELSHLAKDVSNWL